MNQANEVVIQTDRLSKSFGQVHALKSLDLRVPRHSIFGFLGPNGAGKTTTMKLLLGLIRPTSGSGTVFGQDIVRDGVTIRSRVGYLPQQPRFVDDMSARETLRFTAHFFFSGPRPQIEARVEEVLDLVGLQDKADRPVKSFSGGGLFTVMAYGPWLVALLGAGLWVIDAALLWVGRRTFQRSRLATQM